MTRSPCLGCQDRTITPNCHMGCKAYQLFCLERERIRQARLHDGETLARQARIRRQYENKKP